MEPVFDAKVIDELLAPLAGPDSTPGAAAAPRALERRPVHTVYGGAHLFAADTPARLGAAALRALDEYAPDFAAFARAVGMAGADRLPAVPAERARFEARGAAEPDSVRTSEPQAYLAHAVYTRMRGKLEREPVEDYRIDFEDGYGPRPDAEEDAHATAAAESMARAHAAGTLPPFSGLRIRALDGASGRRALRTLERFVGALLAGTGGSLPAGFVVALPKVRTPAQVAALARALERLERAHGLAAGSLRCEIMIETPRALLDADGCVPLAALVAAAGGRCRGAHLGAYDLGASLGVSGADAGLEHPVAGFARRLVQAALAESGVWLADGAVTLLPVPVHRAAEGGALAPAQQQANRAAVHAGWRAHYDSVRRALREGWVQGWDLHPAQLVTRHAATIAHFLEGRDSATSRLRAFLDRAARATLNGAIVDDAATGEGLRRFFAQGLACGALTEAEALASGLTPAELAGGGFERGGSARRR